MTRTNVVIAGGGPAGIATALSLRQNNIECVVIHHDTLQQYKPGETIPPNAAPILEKLGLTSILNNDNHLPGYGNRFVWGSDMPADKTFFTSPFSQGWHINRVLFERDLLKHTITKGIPVINGFITDFIKQEDTLEISYRDTDGKVRTVHCDFIVDATGRASKITRSLGIKRIRLDELTAVWTVLKYNQFDFPHYTYIEAQPDGWWYAAPLAGNKLAAGFFTDADLLNKELTDYNLFKQKAEDLTLISGLLKNCTLEATPAIYPAFTGFLERRYGSNWLAVGDTALSYDPISSYGVISALEGGYYAGHAIYEHLNGREEALPAYDMLITSAFEVFNQMRMGQYGLERRWEDKVFWGRRR